MFLWGYWRCIVYWRVDCLAYVFAIPVARASVQVYIFKRKRCDTYICIRHVAWQRKKRIRALGSKWLRQDRFTLVESSSLQYNLKNKVTLYSGLDQGQGSWKMLESDCEHPCDTVWKSLC